tara:strand:+ start:15684 stop:16184 length:501 start_codon:yes stop_codon:yes gene_type:complete
MTDFDNILLNLNTVKSKNYEKFNIIINNIKSKPPNNTLSYKVKELKNTISKKQYFNSQKIGYKNDLVSSSTELSNSVNIQCESERISWSKLSKKTKKEKLMAYIEKHDIPEDISELIQKQKINKKDVDYDIFIEEITNLNFLTFENETYKIIKKQQKVKKKKKIFK